MAVDTPGSSAIHKSDTERLHELGYAQELGRKMQGFSNMAVSFSIISILAGCLTTYYLALYAGGGPAIAYGWPIVTVMALFVAMSMGEVCSSYPTAGGLYYWSAKLAKRNAPFWSWTTGWFNLIGQIAITAGILNLGLAWHGESTVSLADLQLAFAGASLLAFCSILFALPLAADAATEVSGHKPRGAARAATGD